jgi:tricorn protease
MKLLKHFLVVCLILIASNNISGQQKGYYRFPAIHGNDLIFTAEGDLWRFNLSTNESKRLTTNHGVESHASISPDGKWVAFIGQYEGPSEVYILPLNGGTPKRLTYEEGSPVVYQWTSDGRIMYSTNTRSTSPEYQLVKINPVDRKSEIVPLSQADQGTCLPTGELFFTRLRDQGSHTKRYKGGSAQNIWKFDGKTEAIPMTADYPGTSKDPMYYKERIFFLSDRDGTMNIWSMNTTGADLKQHTMVTRIDLSDADLNDGRIVCQMGADILLYDIATGKSAIPDIYLNTDFDQKRVQWISDPKSKISNIHISYKGDNVVLTSRGRVFSVPVEGDRWSEVTRKYGIRYKDAAYVEAGNDLMMLSDESGEFEVWKTDNFGFKAPEQITKGSNNFIENFLTSPDGNYIIYNEKDNRLMLYSKSADSSSLIATNDFGFSAPFAWSPDSRMVAYIDRGINQNGFIKIYDVKASKSWQITSGRTDDYNPEFSRDGKWLYFISDRTFSTSVGSPWGSRQPEPYYNKTAKIYAVELDTSAVFPFSEATELNAVKTDSSKTTEAADKSKKDRTKAVKSKTEKTISKAENKADLANAGSRLYAVTMKAANISDFELNKDWLYWSEVNSDDNTISLNALKITNKKNNEVVSIATPINSFMLSGDGKKILIRDKTGIVVLNADGTKPDVKKNSVDLTKWAFTIDPVEDWKQMFKDAWRMERDYFYDKNMHGVNWKDVYNQYLPLVDRVTDRYELDDILARMISELSALHMFVYGGDKRLPGDNMSNGYLGAMLTRNPTAGGYSIDHIFRSDPDYPSDLSPLARPNLKITEGDIILSVNGVNTTEYPDINELLVNKADVQVRLKLKNAKGVTYDEVIKPMNASAFSSLRYRDWEYSRRLAVEKSSDNKIGYLHLRAMGGGDYDDFVKNFYPVIGKEGLILDVRHNRGGNIDSWILEKLLRKAWFYWAPRVGQPAPNMQLAFTGHLVVLMDEHTASDGEAFSEGFRRLGLGKLIGVRTWGGEIWLSSGNRLVDNGIATAAETGVYSPEGEWLIEGWGVEPDIKVDNLPYESFNGRDAQLEAAVAHLKTLMKEQPVITPPIPKYPDKSFNYKDNK